ncbi:yecA family protein [Canicola haemoglobinophilus]|uniref:UPF0149 protein NCTC8540_00272 n=1 Tax=Canicola haemoglobinophilus TaxID=733 RepID=A0AB38H6P5_9PAST|nr:YecA family protein [Canicola haemoglobinophilus]STO55473.1 yecA family protein [Canicola haemoglobinophilus]STO67801.1 yecA family protein [Canicola haemoglobinophilus]
MSEQFLTYSELNQQFKQANLASTVAELHGFITGLICGGIRDQSWLPIVYQFTNDDHAYPSAILKEVEKIYQEINRTLSDVDGFNFELWLPEEDDVFARVEAMSEWCNHFLLGLGLNQPNLGKETGEIGEALDDLQNISQLGYEEDDDQEELSEALEEVIEYVRTIACLFFNHFTPASETKEPVLH